MVDTEAPAAAAGGHVVLCGLNELGYRTLEELVGRARSVVVVTSSDIVNLETALNVQTLTPDVRVVLRLFDPDLASRVERAFGIHISRSPSALAAPAFAAAAGQGPAAPLRRRELPGRAGCTGGPGPIDATRQPPPDGRSF